MSSCTGFWLAVSGPGPAAGRTRPPGSRLPDTPVTTLATYTVGGHQFAVVSYADSEGGGCVAVDRDGAPWAWVCDVEVSTKHLVNAGTAMVSETPGPGLGVVYGRAHDSVTDLYAIMRGGERVDWPIHHDPRNQERYFAVIRRQSGTEGHCRRRWRSPRVAQGQLRHLVPRGPVRLARCSHSWATETYRRRDRDRVHNCDVHSIRPIGARHGAEVAPPRPG